MKRAVMMLAVLVAVVGCSSSSSSKSASNAPTSPPPTAAVVATTSAPLSFYAQEYLRLSAPATAALKTFSQKLQALPDSATGPDVQKIATPAADAVSKAIQDLVRVPWPTPAIKADVNALVVAETVIVADLRGFGGQNALSVTAFVNQINTDGAKGAGAVTILRADLGLPPAPTA